MKSSFPNTRLIISLLLFAWAVCAFGYVNPYVFHPTHAYNHIIDVHFQEDHSRFIDSGYVKHAAAQYNPARYLYAYYVLDLLFIFIYSNAFLLLAHDLKKNIFQLFKWSVIVGASLDFLENTNFAIFLFHQDTPFWATLTSFFTSTKSVLFLLNILFSLVAFFFPNISWPLTKNIIPGPRNYFQESSSKNA